MSEPEIRDRIRRALSGIREMTTEIQGALIQLDRLMEKTEETTGRERFDELLKRPWGTEQRPRESSKDGS